MVTRSCAIAAMGRQRAMTCVRMGVCFIVLSSFFAERQSERTPDRGRGSQQGREGTTMNAGTNDGSGVAAARLVCAQHGHVVNGV
jgi:hypothetical protein